MLVGRKPQGPGSGDGRAVKLLLSERRLRFLVILFGFISSQFVTIVTGFSCIKGKNKKTKNLSFSLWQSDCPCQLPEVKSKSLVQRVKGLRSQILVEVQIPALSWSGALSCLSCHLPSRHQKWLPELNLRFSMHLKGEAGQVSAKSF